MSTVPSYCIDGEELGRDKTPAPCAPRWYRRLPRHWLVLVVVPRSFRVHREHEIPARQVFGHDEAGDACFQGYDYRLFEPRLDDDRGLCTVLTYAESVQAWRLIDGRWLVDHQCWPDGEDGELIPSLRFCDRMPREGLQCAWCRPAEMREPSVAWTRHGE